jgi:hypothetical protein
MADRISDEAAEVVYQTLVTLNKKSGFSLNPTPVLTAITPSINGFTVSFTRTATDNGSIASTSWDFGDGSSSTLSAPQHTYASAGAYLVRCRVTDNEGSMNSRWVLVTVPGVATGIKEAPGERLTLRMDNKASGVYTFPESLIFNGECYRVFVYNGMGRVTGKYDIHTGNTVIDLTSQPGGIYFVQAISENGGAVYFEKIIFLR